MNEQITCLRCSACKMLPNTDMTQTTPIVFCEKKQEKTPLILSGCALADPRKYDSQSKRSRAVAKVSGNKLYYVSEVERSWLEVHYPISPMSVILRVTGRTTSGMRTIAKNRGWKRNPKAIVKDPQFPMKAKMQKGTIFTERQSKLIYSCFKENFWPLRVGNFTEEGRAYNDRIRNIITKYVNKAGDNGKVWEWGSIMRHVEYTSPARRRDHAAKNRKHLEKKRLEREAYEH